MSARAPRPPTSTVSVSYYIQQLFATAKAMLVFVFTPRFFCENDDDDGIIKIALFVQSFPCITRHHWLCCGGGSYFHRVFSLLERSTWSKTASSCPPFARLRLFSSQSRAITRHHLAVVVVVVLIFIVFSLLERSTSSKTASSPFARLRLFSS